MIKKDLCKKKKKIPVSIFFGFEAKFAKQTFQYTVNHCVYISFSHCLLYIRTVL